MIAKKGEVEIQFNWILILIAGALIFLFFFSIINWAKDSSDQGISLKIARNLDAILTGASIPRDTAEVIDNIPFERIEFSCGSYHVDKSPNSRAITNKIIFAPTRLEDGMMVTWSYAWDVPFRVTNFLLVSSQRVRYIFITNNGANELFQRLNETFPTDLDSKFYVNPASIAFDDYNNFKVRLIYINTGPNDAHIDANYFKRMGAEDVTALKITPTSDSGGEVVFYRKTEPSVNPAFRCYLRGDALPCLGSTSKYFGYASLLGAIFSENPEDYECNMEKAFDRLGNVAEIYRLRAMDLETYYSVTGDDPNTLCYDVYNGVEPILSDIRDLGFVNIGLFDERYQDLEDQNSVAQSRSCALVY